jgi:hypothetical protein
MRYAIFSDIHNNSTALSRILSDAGDRQVKAYLYKGLEISIHGVKFPATFIAIESPGLDIILGMDWLAPHQVCINLPPEQ